MARPPKYNAEYFSHDADMRNDPKIKALRRKYKLIGYAVYNCLLETLTDNDYFIVEWDDMNIEILAGDYDLDPEELSDIVEYCVKLGLFQIEGGKLQSKNHQKRMKPLLDTRERKRKKQEFQTAETENARVMDVHNPQQTDETDGDNPHSKVKESKGKKSKEEKEKELLAARAATLKREKEFYETLVPYVDKYGKDMIRDFFDYWSEKNKQQTKMRFEQQGTWETSKRLATWANRDKEFKPSQTTEETKKYKVL